MSERKKAFSDIIDSITTEESGVVDELKKSAIEAPIGLTGLTENVKPKTLPSEVPTGGLSSLKYPGKSAVVDDDVNTFDNVPVGTGTPGQENIKVPKIPIDNSGLLSKKAAIHNQLSELVGFDLQKVASEDEQVAFLEKVAQEVLLDTESDLNKQAIDLAHVMADAFIDKIQEN